MPSSYTPLLELAFKHNSPLRRSVDENPHPRARAILFDSIECLTQPEYRNDGLVRHHFGTQAPKDKAIERWTTVY